MASQPVEDFEISVRIGHSDGNKDFEALPNISHTVPKYKTCRLHMNSGPELFISLSNLTVLNNHDKSK